MPKKNIDYSKTIIYKIVPKYIIITIDFIYIGFTTEFRQRKNQHKNGCTNINHRAYNIKIYSMMRENGGWDAFEMIEIEKYPCNNGNEARSRERYYYDMFNANLNSINPYISNEEYKKNKKEYMKIYRELNKDKLKEQTKKYKETHKDIIKEQSKESHKKYYEDNKEKLNQKSKEYRLKKKLERNFI